MSENNNDTPSEQHPAVRRDTNNGTSMDTVLWRLSRVEDGQDTIIRKLDKINNRFADQDSSTKVAIERCTIHGIKADKNERDLAEYKQTVAEDFRSVNKRIDLIKIKTNVSKVTPAAAWSGLIAALSALIWHLISKGN